MVSINLIQCTPIHLKNLIGQKPVGTLRKFQNKYFVCWLMTIFLYSTKCTAASLCRFGPLKTAVTVKCVRAGTTITLVRTKLKICFYAYVTWLGNEKHILWQFNRVIGQECKFYHKLMLKIAQHIGIYCNARFYFIDYSRL